MLGQIGLPGGGFGRRLRPGQPDGQRVSEVQRPELPQGTNAVSDFIPVARITDMLLQPGGTVDYNGPTTSIPTSGWSTGRAAIRSITTRTSTG